MRCVKPPKIKKPKTPITSAVLTLARLFARLPQYEKK